MRKSLVRGGRRLRRSLHAAWRRFDDSWRGTDFSPEEFLRRWGIDRSTMGVVLQKLFDDPAVWPVSSAANLLLYDATKRYPALTKLSEEATRHRFALLGSGLTEVDYQLRARGLEGHRFTMAPGKAGADAQRQAMARLLKDATLFVKEESTADLENINLLQNAAGSQGVGGYAPIDWHVDFKSGYRWDPATWYLDVPIGRNRGADPKVPWELSRFQHTAWLASACGSKTAGTPTLVRDPGQEWVLQVVDWITANPVRRGINWRSAMDVAIRSTNWIWGMALFRNHPALTLAVRWLMMGSLYQHALHIESHLDSYPDTPTDNHYLAEVVGLLHIAAAFPHFAEGDRWLAFCLQELVSEMGRTVYPDGSSYEASTHYHRLVTEMFVHGSCLALRLPAQRTEQAARFDHLQHRARAKLCRPGEQSFDFERQEIFPGWYLRRLERMAEFTRDLTKPNGRVPVFGDADNGRLVKLTPVVVWDRECDRFVEEFRDHRHILAVAGALFQREDLLRIGAAFSLDAELVVGGIPNERLLAVRGATRNEVREDIEPRPLQSGRNGHLKRIAGLEADLQGHAVYPDAGVVIYRLANVWLAMQCGPNGLGGRGGHSHVDKLSFELCVDGEDLIADPGTYVYTSLPDWRNRMRSWSSHNVMLLAGLDGLGLSDDPFVTEDCGRTRLLKCDVSGWSAEWELDRLGVVLRRSVRFFPDSLSNQATAPFERELPQPDQCQYAVRWSLTTSSRLLQFSDLVAGRKVEVEHCQICLAPDARWEPDGDGGTIRGSKAAAKLKASGPITLRPASFSACYGARTKTWMIAFQ